MRGRVCGAALAAISCAGPAPLEPLPVEFPKTPQANATSAATSPAALSVTASSTTPGSSTPNAEGTLPLAAVSQGDIGSAGPAELLAASKSGAWVALCQGSPMTASLVLGSGAGEPIDDVYAQDPRGRYLVSARAGAATLIDSTTGARVDLSGLGADTRLARTDYAAHRTLSFDARGEQLAYLRKQDSQPQIVVRSLLNGSERSFSAGTGDVFRLRISADARFVMLDMLREDTSRNGKLDWPVPEQPANKNSCDKRDVPRFRSFAHQARGDTVTRAIVSLSDGSVRDVPDLVTTLGTKLLVREMDGSLRLEHAGKRSTVSSASCAGRVLFADAQRELALVTCALPKKAGKREVWLVGSGYAKNLQSELYESGTDRHAVTGIRLVALYPGSEAALVDLERRELLPLAAGSRVVAVSGPLALLWRGSDLFRYDAETRTEERLAQGVAKNPDLLQAGDAVLLSPFVILGATWPALRSPAPRALAVSATGHVLVDSSAEGPAAASSAGAIQGPLHWLDARVPPPDGPPR